MNRRLPTEPAALLALARENDRVALARLVSMVERGGEPGLAVARLAYRAPVPYTVGLTGRPGRRQVDPHRPAHHAGPVGLAGARPPRRSTRWACWPSTPPRRSAAGRSWATGSACSSTRSTRPSSSAPWPPGGTSGAWPWPCPTPCACSVRRACPWSIVETVGVGQMEVEVASAADTTMVVVTPGWGDSMQANKAGLLEIADLFVINKADRPGAREARRDLEQMLDLSSLGAWRPPIVDTVASTGEGLEELWDEIARHRAHLRESGMLEQRRAERMAHELRRVLMARSAGEDRRAGRRGGVRQRGQGPGGGGARPLPGRRSPHGTMMANARPVRTTVHRMAEPFVTVERRPDGVALVRLDRPKANALSGAVLGQIFAAATALHDDPPGAVVLWGGRRIFAAGADIVELDGAGADARGGELHQRPGGAGQPCPAPPSPPSTGTRWGAGWSWPWRATSGSAPRTPGSGSPRCCSGSSPVAAGRSACPASSVLAGQGAHHDRAPGPGGRGVGHRAGEPGGGARRGARRGAGVGRRVGPRPAGGARPGQVGHRSAASRARWPTGWPPSRKRSAAVARTEDAGAGIASFAAHGPGKATFVGR